MDERVTAVINYLSYEIYFSGFYYLEVLDHELIYPIEALSDSTHLVLNKEPKE